MRRLVFIGFSMMLAASAHPAEAQSPVSVPTSSCRQNIDSLQHRIELNYAGYLLEVTGTRKKRLDDTLVTLRTLADRTASTECLRVLKTLVDWYHDPHLFVYQADIADSALRGALPGQRRDMDERTARTYLASRGTRLDPIEGIWYDRGLRVAIVPAVGKRAEYDAVVISSDTNWAAGDIHAHFTRRSPDHYDAIVWTNARTRKVLDGVIHKRILLRLSPGIWGKEYPVARADSGLLDPVDPHRATLRVRDHTVIVSVPSHDPSHRFTLDTLLAQNDSALRHAARLIVDLRGNEGGSSWVTGALEPFMVTEPPRRTPYPDSDTAMILSSPNLISYATRSFAGPGGPDSTPALRRLLARMRANPGKLVPFADSAEAATPRPTPIFGPSRVAVMVDRGTVSAAEVFVLRALASTRATVIGQPTEGALDYQSTNIVWFSTGERRWGLGFPTITRSAHLPANGMRGVGIRPDVFVNWESVADPIRFTESWLRSHPGP